MKNQPTISQAEQVLIHFSATGDKSTVVKLSQTPGININAKDENGMTALMHAIENDQPYIYSYLLEDRRVDINATDNQGRTALIQAITRGNTSAVISLLKHGANFSLDQIADVRTVSQISLIYATFWSSPENAASLLQARGVNINSSEEGGITALMFAATIEETQEKKNSSIIEAILRAGADTSLTMSTEGVTKNLLEEGINP